MTLVYNDRSVLENYHISAAFKVMREKDSDILINLSREEYRYDFDRLRSAPISTDRLYWIQSLTLTAVSLQRVPYSSDRYGLSDWHVLTFSTNKNTENTIRNDRLQCGQTQRPVVHSAQRRHQSPQQGVQTALQVDQTAHGRVLQTGMQVECDWSHDRMTRWSSVSRLLGWHGEGARTALFASLWPQHYSNTSVANRYWLSTVVSMNALKQSIQTKIYYFFSDYKILKPKILDSLTHVMSKSIILEHIIVKVMRH